MSGPPEGSVWFQHKSLRCKNFEPSDPAQFYSHVLLEVIYNNSYDEAYYKSNLVNAFPRHPRVGPQVLNHSTSTCYIRFEGMTVMAGPSHSDLGRIQSCVSSSDYKDVNRECGNLKVAYVPVMMPTVAERFLWLDLTYPLRGIYVPRLHVASPRAEEWCIYDRLEFRLRELNLKTYKMLVREENEMMQKLALTPGAFLNAGFGFMGSLGGKQNEPPKPTPSVPEPDLPDDYVTNLKRSNKAPARFEEGTIKLIKQDDWGWGLQYHWTARIDIFRLIRVLLIPDNLLKDEYKNPYDCVTLFDCTSVDKASWQVGPALDSKPYNRIDMANSEQAIDIVNMIGKEYGIEIQYKVTPKEDTWKFVLKTINGLVKIGTAMIPMIGPFVALGQEFVLNAILDPEGFVDSFKDKEGLADNLTKITEAFVGAGENTRSFLKDRSKAPTKLLLEEDNQKQAVYVGEDGAVDTTNDTGEKPTGEDDSTDAGGDTSGAGTVNEKGGFVVEETPDEIKTLFDSIEEYPVHQVYVYAAAE